MLRAGPHAFFTHRRPVAGDQYLPCEPLQELQMRQEPAVDPQQERVDDAHETAPNRGRPALVEVSAERQEDWRGEMKVLTRRRPDRGSY